MGLPGLNAFQPDPNDDENVQMAQDPSLSLYPDEPSPEKRKALMDMYALTGGNFKNATRPGPSDLLALNDSSNTASDAGTDLFIKGPDGKIISPEVYNKSIRRYGPGLQQEEEGINSQVERLKGLQSIPVQPSLQGAYNLTKVLGGPELNYTPPKAPEEHALDLAKLENSIQSQRRGLTSEQMSALKDRINAQTADSRMKQAQAMNERMIAKMGLTQGNAEGRLALGANKQYTQALQPIENTLYSANKIKELVSKILAVDPNDQSEKTIKATKGLMAEINRAQSTMLAGGAKSTVHGDMSMEQNTALGDFAKKMTYLTGQAYNTTTRPLLQQALIDTDFLGKNISANHDIAFHSLIAGLPDKLQQAMTKRYDTFRSGLSIDKQFPKEESPSGGSPFPGGTANAAGQEKPTGPKVGDVMKGYRYKGGKPGDQNSWEKVQ